MYIGCTVQGMKGDRGMKGDVGPPGSVTSSSGDLLKGPPGLPGLPGPQVIIGLDDHMSTFIVVIHVFENSFDIIIITYVHAYLITPKPSYRSPGC